MTTEDSTSQKLTMAENFQKWLFNQGASTVLLFLIVLGIGWTANNAVPAQVKAIQDGYDKNALMLDRAAERYERTIEKVVQSVDKLTDNVEQLSNRVDRLIDERSRRP